MDVAQEGVQPLHHELRRGPLVAVVAPQVDGDHVRRRLAAPQGLRQDPIDLVDPPVRVTVSVAVKDLVMG